MMERMNTCTVEKCVVEFIVMSGQLSFTEVST